MRNDIRNLILGIVLGVAAFPVSIAYAEDDAALYGDDRTPVMLRPKERTRVLNDMRQYLTGLQEMFAALEHDEIGKVAETAKKLGAINIYDPKLMFPSRSDVRFRELSNQVHVDFESLAEDMDKLKDRQDAAESTRDIMGRLSRTMRKCVACHESFRLTSSAHSGSEMLERMTQDPEKKP